MMTTSTVMVLSGN